MENNKIITYSVIIKAPIVKDNSLTAVCHALKLQNAGTTEIKVGGGWTLMPGGSLEIGNHSNCNVLLQRLSVSFGTVTEVPGKAAVNRLEIMEWQINDSVQAHFDG